MDTFNSLDAAPKFQPRGSKIKHFSLKLGQYFILLLFFIVLAGHESVSTRKTDRNIEFYIVDFQRNIELQLQIIQVHTALNSNSDISNQINLLSQKFYNKRDYQPAWTINYLPSKNLENLLTLIDSAEYFGFPVDYFNGLRIKTLISKLNNTSLDNNSLINTRIELEIQASQSALLYMLYLKEGIIFTDTTTLFQNRISEIPEKLISAINENNLVQSVLSIQPELAIYKEIKSNLPDLLKVINTINNAFNNEPNTEAYAKALQYAGIIKFANFDSVNNTEKLTFVFQKTYNLNQTGKFDNDTRKELVSILRFRYYQVCLNLDRLRKININQKDYIFVNIPEYKLHLYKNGQKQDEFNVIVGAKKTPTPVLKSHIRQIVTNPFWTVPRSIVKNEMLFQIRKDSTFLQRNGYYVIDNFENKIPVDSINWNAADPLGKKYWIRQHNNSSNALGKVKFIFPNGNRVYLHDTQSKRLFKKNNRAYSHGCIRLQNPERLAQYLINNYTNERKLTIKKLLLNKKLTEIDLTKQISIYLQYITCKADSESGLEFLKDVYKKDKEDIKSLFPVSINI